MNNNQTRSFRRVRKNWNEFWAEFWRIRLVGNDEAVGWKNQQVVDFCTEVLKIKPGMSVLDLACGAGFQAMLFSEQGLEVHGIDITEKLIRHARQAAKKKKVEATFETGDMRSFKVPRPFDRVVVLGMSFGFGSDEENQRSLQSIFRATKPGGWIMLTGQHPYTTTNSLGPEWMETDEGFLVHRPSFDPLTSRLGGTWELVRPDGTVVSEGENPESDGIRCYTAPEMSRMLAEAGFVKPKYYGSWYLPPAELQWFSPEMITVAHKPAK